MASRYEVDVTITSAKDLKNVNWRHGKLKPYAVIWVDPNSKSTTRVDDKGDTTPNWDAKFTIPFNSPIGDSTLHIDIVHADAADSTKPLIGSAKLPLRDVFDDVGLESLADKSLQMKRPSGRPQGKVSVKVSVREPRYIPPPSYVVTQPVYVAQAAYATPAAYVAPPTYAAPPAGYPVGYGAPPPVYGRAPAQVEEKKKSSKFGTGLAVGALAGGLGGLALAGGIYAMENKIADDVEHDLAYDDDDDDGDF